jgi:zinc protease
MKTRLLIITILLFVVSAINVFGGAITGNVIEKKLPNGLTLVMKEVHSAPVVNAQIWFRTGSRNEYSGITGISHLLEHMLFNSSSNYKKGEITRLIQERGGIENGATAQDFTYYWNMLSSEHLDFAIRILAEKTGNALLKPNELKNERGIVLSELQGYANQPDRLLYDAVNFTAYTAHAYRCPIGGWQTDVANVPHQDLVNYYKKYYYPSNATLVLVGDFDVNEAVRLATKYFGSKPAGKPASPLYTTEPVQHGEKRITLHREGSSERVLLAYHIPAFANKDTWALMMLDQILSGGRASRLYQSLVETRLASGSWSSASSRKDPGLFYIGATAMKGVSLDKLEQAIGDIIEQAKKQPPTENEMQAAKNQLEAYMVFQNDSVSDQGEQLGYYNTTGSWKDLDRMYENVKKVTPQQVQEVAVKYLTQDNKTVGRFIPIAPGPEMPGGGAGALQAHANPTWDKLNKYPIDKLPVLAKTAPISTKKQSQITLPKRYVLDNGLVLLIHENHSNPTVAISGLLKAGACFDPKGKSGTAELTASMLNRGTTERSALQIASQIEFVGASISFSAGDEAADFGAQCLTKDLDMVTQLLADQLRNPSFPEAQFSMLQRQMLNGIDQSKESTGAQAFRAFNNSVFPDGHAYHALTFEQQLAETSSVNRDDLVSFHKTYYRPDNMIVTVVGDVKPADVIALFKQRFGDWKGEGPKPVVDIPLIKSQTAPKKIVVNIPDKTEVSVVMGFASEIKRKDPDYYAYRIMNQVLGGSGALGSILGQEIREKRGLAYNVYSTYSGTLGAGAWYASLGTSPDNTTKAINTVTQVIKRYKEKGPTEAEFQNARRFIVGVLPIALETNSGMAGFLTSVENIGLGTDYLRKYRSIYGGVTIDQVKKAAKRYLHPEAATLVIAGSYKEPAK